LYTVGIIFSLINALPVKKPAPLRSLISNDKTIK